jgi:hypothetical protein
MTKQGIFSRFVTAMEEDPEVVTPVLTIAFALLVYATLLYLLTSKREPTGLRFFPATTRAWVNYAARALMLAVIAFATPLFITRDDPVDLLVIAIVGLAAAAVVLREANPPFAYIGGVLLVLIGLLLLLLPMVVQY